MNYFRNDAEAIRAQQMEDEKRLENYTNDNSENWRLKMVTPRTEWDLIEWPREENLHRFQGGDRMAYDRYFIVMQEVQRVHEERGGGARWHVATVQELAEMAEGVRTAQREERCSWRSQDREFISRMYERMEKLELRLMYELDQVTLMVGGVRMVTAADVALSVEARRDVQLIGTLQRWMDAVKRLRREPARFDLKQVVGKWADAVDGLLWERNNRRAMEEVRERQLSLFE